MSPRVLVVLVVLLGLGLALSPVTSHAQPAPGAGGAARRPVRAGDVTGVELGLEGALRVTRGQPLRWLVTVHEVVGLQDLRPAPGAQVQVLSSLDPAAPAADVQADARGRAVIAFDVPEDAPPSFRVVIEAVARAGVRRRFELDVQTLDPRVLTVHVARAALPPGATLRAFGRLEHRTTGRGLA